MRAVTTTLINAPRQMAEETEVDYRDPDRSQTPLEETPLLAGTTNHSQEKKYASAEEAFDVALSRVPVGPFHLLLIVVCGLALASYSVEVQCVSFVKSQLDSSNPAHSNQVIARFSNKKSEREIFSPDGGKCAAAGQVPGGSVGCHHFPWDDGGKVSVGQSVRPYWSPLLSHYITHLQWSVWIGISLLSQLWPLPFLPSPQWCWVRHKKYFFPSSLISLLPPSELVGLCLLSCPISRSFSPESLVDLLSSSWPPSGFWAHSLLLCSPGL